MTLSITTDKKWHPA